MCGLVGIMSSNMLMKHKQVLASLLYLDTWRGRDSTGVAMLRHNADTAIMKSTVPGYEFVEGNKLEDALKLNDFLWIGHNRYGTMGKNIKTNAHPFGVYDEDGGCMIVGAHNGTLKNKHVLMNHATFGTDSEALFNNIAHEGIEESIKKIEGAWALTYYDHIVEEFRIIRNKERPLFYAFEKGKHSLIWASEAWMIRVSCSRHGVELEDDKVLSFNEDTLYKIPVPIKMNETLELKRKGGLVGKAPAFFQGGFWHSGQWYDRQPEPERTQTAPPRKTPPLKLPLPSGTEQKSNGVVQMRPNAVLSVVPSDDSAGRSYKGYSGRVYTKTEIEDQLKDGCGWCEKQEIKLDDKGYGWLAPDKPICSLCLEGKHEDHEMIDAIFDQAAIPASQIN